MLTEFFCFSKTSTVLMAAAPSPPMAAAPSSPMAAAPSPSMAAAASSAAVLRSMQQLGFNQTLCSAA